MRKTTVAFDDVSNDSNRKPVHRITVRDLRLRFTLFTQGDNPWSLQDGFTIDGQVHAAGTALTRTDGKILRVWGKDGNLRSQIVTPTTSTDWAHSTNAWGDLGFSARVHTNPSVIYVGSLLYMFYVVGPSGQVVDYRTSSGGGGAGSWGTSATTGNLDANFTPQSVAAISDTEVFAIGYDSSLRAIRIRRLYYDGAAWQAEYCPWSIVSNGDTTLSSLEWSTVTYFHAVQVDPGGKRLLVFTYGAEGQSYYFTFDNGLWGEKRLLIPDDYSKFSVYRMTVIQGKVWLAGRLKRTNANQGLYSPAFDCYLVCDNQFQFSAMARDSFLTRTEARGHMLLAGAYVYYFGLYSVWRAPATYLIDPAADPTAQKVDISADLISASANFPSAGSAPQLTLTLKNDDDGYFTGSKAALVAGGSQVYFEVGYETSTGPVYIATLEANVDAIERGLASGSRVANLTARCSAFKKLRDYSLPFYWELKSQLKHFDACDKLDELAIASGKDWSTEGANLVQWSGFEGTPPLPGEWSEYKSGAATGTSTQVYDQFYQGVASDKLVKTGGADADDYGVQVSKSLEANSTYKAEVWVYVTVISGGTQTVTFKASGNWGAGGSAQSASASRTGVSSGWVKMEVTFTTVVAATVTLAIFFDSCSANSTMYVDEVKWVKSPTGYIRFTDQTDTGILLSVEPFETEDFDIRTQFMDHYTTDSADYVRAGLVGLATDKDNLIAFRVIAGASSHKLSRRRGENNWVDLAASSSFTVLRNVVYDLRMVHKGGRFLCYIKRAGPYVAGTEETFSTTDWGGPIIDYRWNMADGPPCLSNNGRGKVGLLAEVRPRSFLAYGMDKHSTVICLRYNATVDNDWSLFPSSGEVRVEDERMTYGGKGTDFTLPAMRLDGYHDGGAASEYAGTPALPAGWTHFVEIEVAPGTNYKFWGLVFTAGQEPFAAWFIDQDTIDSTSFPGIVAHTHATGHDNTNGITEPYPHKHEAIFSDPSGIACQLVPVMSGVTRGANNTVAATHPDIVRVYKYADDELRFYHFLAFDYETDYCTQDALKRVAAMAGVLSTVFVNKESGADLTPAEPLGQVWSATPSWLSHNNQNIDFRCTLSSVDFGINTVRAGLLFRSSSNTDWAAAEGRVVYLGYDAGQARWFCGLMNKKAADTLPSELELLRLADTFQTGTTLIEFRVVVTGNFITVYANDAIVGSFYDSAYDSGVGYGYAAVTAFNRRVTFKTVTVPELTDWRDAMRLDNDAAGASLLSGVFQDRPIKYISQSGTGLKFSYFDSRENLGNFSDLIFSEVEQAEDTDLVSFMRIYAEEILELDDPTLARDRGFVYKTVHLPHASLEQAALMFTRLFRQVNELSVGRSSEIAGDLRFENEDKFTALYTAVATGLSVNAPLIVTDVTYRYKIADLVMQVGARKWVS